MTIKCLSLNAKELNHPAKCYSMWKEALKSHADILSIQETHFFASNNLKCFHKQYPHVFFSCTSDKKKSVLIAIRNILAFQLKDAILDSILTYDINSRPYTLVAVYTSNLHQLRFLRKLLNRIHSIKFGHLLICGDFNLTSDPEMDFSSNAHI